MKIKTSDFSDFACIFPISQQIIGIPLVCYQLICLINDLFRETFYKEDVKNINANLDQKIADNKINKINCFVKRKDTSAEIPAGNNYKLDTVFDRYAFDNRYRNEEYQKCSKYIQDARYKKIDSMARLAELGFAVLRALPLVGTCYSLYVFQTSQICIPLVPNDNDYD